MVGYLLKTKLHIILLLSVMSGCSFLNLSYFYSDEKLVVDTEPTKAKIFTVEGKEVGETPLEVGSAEISSIKDDDFLYMVIKKPGHVDQLLVAPSNGIDTYKVRLFPHKEENYGHWMTGIYGKKTNKLVREILKIQGLLLQKKLDQAKKRLDIFQKSFPGVAASHTMLGNIHYMNRKYEDARAEFLRALSIDSQDQTASRFLEVVKKILE